MKTIWFDIDNVPHVNFFKPVINELEKKYNLIFTIREFAETIPLFEKKIAKPYKVIGKHKGGKKIMKVIGVFERTIQLLNSVDYFDLKISIGGDSSNLCAKLRNKKSITFDDNEQAPNWRYSWLSDFAFWPDAVDIDILKKQGFKERKLFRYPGFKEDVYIADYKPNERFYDNLPFRNFVTVRAENIQANYVDSNSTIVPELLKKLSANGYNILFLPRYQHDRQYAKDIDNVFIPENTLDGLDICYYSDAILTGAGTLAREAACFGVPSVSFYAGKNLLAVDKKMIKEKMLFHSRNVDEILQYLKNTGRKEVNIEKSKKVQKEVIDKLKSVISQMID